MGKKLHWNSANELISFAGSRSHLGLDWSFLRIHVLPCGVLENEPRTMLLQSQDGAPQPLQRLHLLGGLVLSGTGVVRDSYSVRFMPSKPMKISGVDLLPFVESRLISEGRSAALSLVPITLSRFPPEMVAGLQCCKQGVEVFIVFQDVK